MMIVLVDARFLPGKGLVLGSTLVEVLVALLVLGIGIIGFSAIQLQSAAVVNDAYYRAHAVAIAQDVIERIRANPRGWPSHYASQEWQGSDTVVVKSCVASTLLAGSASGCDQVNDIAEFDHFEVSQQLRISLPKATASIYGACAGGGGVSCIDVAWGEADTGVRCSAARGGIDEVMDRRCVSVNFIAYRQQ